MSAGAPLWKVIAVWVARVLSGATFILSGWAKTVDPRGFVFKIEEYLQVWGIADSIPREITVILAVLLALFELTVGVLLFTGSLRRSTPVFGLLLMAFMLPLTLYIAIADPVADCGCFGDLLVISNTATFIKNIVLTGLLVICLLWYKAAGPLYRPDLQWLVITLTCVYGLTVTTLGWQFQPLVDFRPYGVGKSLASDAEAESPIKYVYEKDGQKQTFSLDALPDSTWTFVEQAFDKTSHAGLTVFDGDDEVTDDLFTPDMQGETLVIVVTEPGIDNLMRSRLANEIYDYARSNGIQMFGLVGLAGEDLEQWKSMATPKYPVYSASDTDLKELVRGTVGLVYLHDGRVQWKRNFATIDPEILSKPDPMHNLVVVDDGRVALWLSGCYGLGMLLLLGISALTKIKIRPVRKKKVE